MRNIRPAVMLLLAIGMGLAAVSLAAVWLNSRASLLTTRVVVAKEDMQMGTRLHANMLEVMDWPGASPIRNPIRNLEDAAGRVVNTAMVKGEPILLSKLAAKGETGGLSAVLGEGRRAVTVKVNEIIGVAGFALPGNFVDVMINTSDSNNNPVSKIVIERIQVLAVAQDVATQESKPKVVNAVTLDVTPEQAEKIDLARSVGTLSLVLRSQVDQQSVPTAGARKTDLLPMGSATDVVAQGNLPKWLQAVKTRSAGWPNAAQRGQSRVDTPPPPASTEVIRGLIRTTE